MNIKIHKTTTKRQIMTTKRVQTSMKIHKVTLNDENERNDKKTGAKRPRENTKWVRNYYKKISNDHKEKPNNHKEVRNDHK